MAKRRRPKSRRSKKANQRRQSRPAGQIDKPATYPPPDERKRIIQQRDKLLEELIPILVQSDGDETNAKINQLVQKYGLSEVQLVLSKFSTQSTSRELIGDETSTYREYRRTFARFGGDRPFLNRADYETLILEYGKLLTFRKLKSFIPFLNRKSKREKELYDLLLSGVEYWEDITPPNVPPRPADFEAPPPGNYSQPAQPLLKLGWADQQKRLRAMTKNIRQWRSGGQELLQMVLDEGLLAGWPGEDASWAPYHALHLLGYLKADEHAEKLLDLFDQENDWLSDQLAVVWGRMGPPAAAPLWAYLRSSRHDPRRRSVAVSGLGKIAGFYPEYHPQIVEGLIQLLADTSADDPTQNSYIIHILDDMDTIEAQRVISDAFEQDRVDLNVVQPMDIDFLYDV